MTTESYYVVLYIGYSLHLVNNLFVPRATMLLETKPSVIPTPHH